MAKMIRMVVVVCLMGVGSAGTESLDGVSYRDWSSRRCSATLQEVASIATGGCAGFEAFELDGVSMIAAANFWDGQSHDMSAKSDVYSLSQPSAQAQVELAMVQRMPTKGAHGWDFFETGEGDRLLVVPNYYGCGSQRGPAAVDAACRSTAVYRWHADSSPPGGGQREGAGGTFKLEQTVATSGPGQTDHFRRGADTYMLVGENFADQIGVFVWNGSSSSFSRVQTLVCPGAGATAVADIKGDIWLVATSYHGGATGWATQSPVFVWEKGAAGFAEVEKVAGFGVHDADILEFKSRHYLVLSQDRDPYSSRIHSQVLVFDEAKRRFVQMQLLATDGAHAAELFVSGGLLWLAVANFGDRLGERYAAQSSLWRLDEAAAAQEGGGVEGLGQFVLETEVASQGATDWEHFVLGGQDYLVLANEGDVSNSLHQHSPIFRLAVECSHANDKPEL